MQVLGVLSDMPGTFAFCCLSPMELQRIEVLQPSLWFSGFSAHLWMLCRYQGAWRLYIELVRPLYRKVRPQVDAARNRTSSVLVRQHPHVCLLMKLGQPAHTSDISGFALSDTRTKEAGKSKDMQLPSLCGRIQCPASNIATQ